MPPAAAVILRPLVWGAALLQLSGLPAGSGTGILGAFGILGLAATLLAMYRARRPAAGIGLAVLECLMAAFVVLRTGGLGSAWFLLFAWQALDQWHSRRGIAVVLALIPLTQVTALAFAGPASAMALLHAVLYGALLAAWVYRQPPPDRAARQRNASDHRPATSPAAVARALADAQTLAHRLQPLSHSPSDPARAAGSLTACLRQLVAEDPEPDRDLHYSPFRIDEVIETVACNWAPLAARRGIDIYLHLDPALDGSRFGDRERLESLLRFMLFAACYRGAPTDVLLGAFAGDESGLEIRLQPLAAGTGDLFALPVTTWLQALASQLGGDFRCQGGSAVARLAIETDDNREKGSSRPLAGLTAHITGDSALAPTLRDYLAADGAALVEEPGSADLILVGECARDHRAELRCRQLRERHPGSRIICQGITGDTAAGVLLEADGLIPMPLTRQGLVRAVREQATARPGAARPEHPVRGRPDAGPGPGPAPRGRVLIAEDDAISARVVTKFLEDAGVEVERTVDGRAALRALKRGGVALALLDMHMPGMSGVEVAGSFRQWEKQQGAHATPLVALTASDDREDHRTCSEAGMDGFLLKPLQRETLLELLDRYAVG